MCEDDLRSNLTAESSVESCVGQFGGLESEKRNMQAYWWARLNASEHHNSADKDHCENKSSCSKRKRFGDDSS